MFIFYFLLFLILSVEAGYVSHTNINTKFNKKSEIFDFLTKPKFYFKYLDVVEAKDIVFKPEIKDLNSEIIFPQEISYYSIPKISFLPTKLTKIKIDQKWYREEDKFLGNIKTKYLELNITIEPIMKNKNYFIFFKGEIIRKNFLVPEKYLDKVLEEFGEIFNKIAQ